MKKLIGIIKKYDGASGIIVDEKGNEYLLLKHNIVNEKELHVNDKVEFTKEIFKTIEIEEKLAIFVTKK